MIEVDFYGFIKNEQQIIAIMSFDGEQLSWKICKDKNIEDIINDEIIVDEKEIYPDKQPEEFIKNLYKSYSGTYLRAGKPRIGK